MLQKLTLPSGTSPMLTFWARTQISGGSFVTRFEQRMEMIGKVAIEIAIIGCTVPTGLGLGCAVLI